MVTKSKILLWSLFILFAFASNSIAMELKDMPPQGALSPEQSKKVLSTPDKVHIIDVRSQEEFQAGHLEQAKLIPLPDFKDKISKLPTDKPLILICRSGSRAQKAYDLIKAARPDLKVWYVNALAKYENGQLELK